jgi:muramidase (phage lysozyme)
MGLLEDLIGGSSAPVTPGLLDAAGYMDPAQYDRARRSSAMDGLWAGLLAGGGPSLTPRNFFSALGTGMQGREQYGEDFDQQQLRAAQAAKARGDVIVSGENVRSQRLGQQIVQDIIKRRQQGGEGSGSTGGQATAPGAGDGGGGTAGAGGAGGGREVASMTADSTLPPEARGLLDTIAGPESAGAYNIRYTPKGGATFDSYDTHPRIAEPGPQGPSTAAGRYQIVASTYDPLAEKYGFKDFKPETQDQAAWHLAQDTYRQKTGGDLLADLQAGKTQQVQSALSGQWATLRMDNFGANVEKYRRASAVAANEIPDVGTHSLDQANLPSIRAPGDPRVSQAFPEVPSYAGALGGPAAPLPGAVAGGPPPAPAPGLTVLGAPVDRAYQLNAMTPQQQHEANLAAGGRGIFPPGQKFNRNGSPISADLTATLPGQRSGANIPPAVARSLGRGSEAPAPAPAALTLPQGPAALSSASNPQPGDIVNGLVFKGGNPDDPKSWAVAPRGAVTPGQGASLGPPDTVVATRAPPPIPGLGGVPPAADGAPTAQLAAMAGDGGGPNLVSGLRPRPAPAPTAMVPDAAPAAAAGPPGVMPGAFSPAIAADPNAPLPAMPAPPQPIAPPPLPPRQTGQVQIPALPAPAPGMTTGGLTAPQLRQSQDMQDLALAFGLMKIPVPSFVEKQAELQAAGQLAAAQKAATQPFEFQMKLFEDSLQQRRDEWNKLSDQQKDQVAAANNMQRDQYKAGLDAVGDRIKQFTTAGLAGQTARDQERARLEEQQRLAPGIEYDKELMSGAGKQVVAARADALSAVRALTNLDDTKQQLQGSGIFSGAGANEKLTVARVFQELGWPSEKIANTQTYLIQAGQAAVEILRSGAFGTGTGISSTDRAAAEKLAAGDTTLDIATIKRVLEISERRGYRNIESFNNQIAKHPRAAELRVEPPDRFHDTTADGRRVYRKPDGSLVVKDY